LFESTEPDSDVFVVEQVSLSGNKVVFPMVVYHSQDRWNVPRSFACRAKEPECWRPHLLNFTYDLVGVGEIPDESISRHPVLRAGLLVLKYAKQATVPLVSIDPIFLDLRC